MFLCYEGCTEIVSGSRWDDWGMTNKGHWLTETETTSRHGNISWAVSGIIFFFPDYLDDIRKSDERNDVEERRLYLSWICNILIIYRWCNATETFSLFRSYSNPSKGVAPTPMSVFYSVVLQSLWGVLLLHYSRWTLSTDGICHVIVLRW